MTAAEMKAYKAKQLRYKKPIVRGLNVDTIQSELWDMISACEDRSEERRVGKECG